MLRILPATTALLLTICAPWPTNAGTPRDDRSFERTYAVSATVTLDADTRSGAVRVRTGDDRTVVVRGEIKRKPSWRGFHVSDAQIARLRTHPPVRQDGDTVRIERLADEALDRGVSIDFEIVVPASTSLVVKTESGGVSVAGTRSTLRIETGSGAIDVEAAAGSGEIRSGSGAVRVTGGLQTLEMETGSGSIEAEMRSVRTVGASSGSGSVRISGVDGGLRAETGSGKITLEGRPADAWKVRSRSGSVSIRVPGDSAFDLAARSRSGSVKAELAVSGSATISKHAFEGSVNGGGPAVDVETGSSSITLGS